jgi:hypothetical protein
MQIMGILHEYLDKNKDIRFGQALRNLGIVVDKWNVSRQENEWANHFNEEPQFMLTRILKRKENKNGNNQ